MLKTAITVTLALLTLHAVAQNNERECSCSILFKEAVHKVSTVYAGFDDKVTVKTRPSYLNLKSRLEKQAAKTRSERGCYEVIRQYTDFFNDSHVGVWFAVRSSPEKQRTINLGDTLMASQDTQDTLTGTWTTADRKERYAIIKDQSGVNSYIAVTLASPDTPWKKGMVKAEFYRYDSKLKLYRGMYYQKDFGGVLNGFTYSNNRIDHWFGPSWYRENQINDKELTGSNNNGNNVEFKIINQDFIYIRFSKFNQEDVDKLDSLIKANRLLIHSKKNLILDLRGNPGGNSSSSEEMIQLIYTNPIIYPSWQYRSSPEYITARKKAIAELQKCDAGSKQLMNDKKILQQLIAHPGKLVGDGEDKIRKKDSINRFPQRIAFLIDEKSGSSAEFFTFEGKQSKKVTTFGHNTYGVMDYGEDQSFNLSCGQYIVTVPWGQNGWVKRFGYRIDNIGFAPDVRIPETETDWVQFVVDFWSR